MIITIALMLFVFIGCVALLESDAYAVTDAASNVAEQNDSAETPTPPDKVKIKKQITGHEAVLLAWKPVKSSEGTVYYEVRQGKKVVKYDKNGKKKKATGLQVTNVRIPLELDADGRLPNSAKYSIYAYIVKSDAEGKEKKWYSKPSQTDKIRVIHQMYVSFKAKSGAKYYSSRNTNKSLGTLKAGKTYYAFGGTRVNSEYNATYIIRLNGRDVYVKPSSATNVKQLYSFKKPFTDAEVESFINDSGLDSNPVKVKGKNRPRRMIWVNTYNQRLYLFKGSKGKWKIEKKLPANTGGGKLLTPYGIQKITGKWDKKRTTGTKWWCIFNGVGIHQKLRQALGKPLSGGCVRIPTDEAKWFYYNISKRTTVYVY